MAFLIFALLHYISLTSSKSVFSFYGASAYGAVHGDRPVHHSFQATTKSTLTAEEDIILEVPDPVNNNAADNSKEGNAYEVQERSKVGTVTEVQGRTLPILRADADSVKLPDKQQIAYVHESTTNREVVPGHKILHQADVLTVDHGNEGLPDQKLGFRNALSHVQVKPTDTASKISATTAYSLSTASPISKATTTVDINDNKPPIESTKQIISELEAQEKRPLQDTREQQITNDMPSSETYVTNKETTKLTISSIDDLSQGSALAKAIVEEDLTDPHQKLLEPKSSEDEDTDTFEDFDEKSDVYIEFQDSEGTTPATVRWSPTIPTTLTYNDNVTTEESDSGKTTTPGSATDDPLLDLVMLFVKLLPEVDEPSIWSKIIAGLQCALRDCRRAFPRLTTVATPIGNGTFIIRRARSECVCPLKASELLIYGKSYFIKQRVYKHKHEATSI